MVVNGIMFILSRTHLKNKEKSVNDKLWNNLQLWTILKSKAYQQQKDWTYLTILSLYAAIDVIFTFCWAGTAATTWV